MMTASLLSRLTSRRKQILTWVTLCGGLMLFWACATVTETGRSAVRLFPESQMVSMASGEFDKMKVAGPISNDPEMNARIQRIGKRVASVVNTVVPPEKWEFVVFDDDTTVNAFALPGGKVGVYTGLIKLAGSDDEIACVIGHEVAHVTAQHGNERVSQQTIAQAGGMAVQYGVKNKTEQTQQLAMMAYGLGAQYGLLLPYSRTHEREADQIGLLYAARAGYNPNAAVTFWQKMAAKGGAQPPQFLSTHPSNGDRIQRLQAQMPMAMVEYEKSPFKGK
ncbi:MAG: M48 family metallopeptidase [Verrucomicrobiota bacterium]|nr:M48 family metallopeptidase [Verrucomicrobiota bacterium]